MLPPITAWLTPAGPGNYQSFDAVIADLETLRRKTRGTHETRVAIPTCYGPYLQGQMERPLYRTLADELCPASIEGVAALRARFEAAGFPCDGWCVPRSPANGILHGQVAGQFERFFLNTEWGWGGFWLYAANVPAVEQYLEEFRRNSVGVGRVGWTMVPNTMLDISTNGELRAWAQGTDVVCLETYTPEDPNLDPFKGLNRWFDRAGPLGITQPATLMLEKGDLGDYLANLTEATFGVHLWTLNTTRAGIAALPDSEEPMPDPPIVEPGYSELEKRLIGALGYAHGDLVAQLRAETNRRSPTTRRLVAPRRSVLNPVINELERATA